MTALSEFFDHVRTSCREDTFVRLSLSSPAAGAAPTERVIARLVDVRGERSLSLTFREARRDTVRNEPVDAGIAEIERLLRDRVFRGAMLATTAADWQLRVDDGGEPRLIRHRASSSAAPPRAHDEKKPTLLAESALPWLQALEIVDHGGRPRRRFADKHAQIDRYTEILSHLARDCGWDRAGGTGPLRIVDVGCGKGHLTFAAWHLGRHVLGRAVEVTGVEVRGDLVDRANVHANAFAGGELRFVRGDIETVPLPAADALIALHACNTATDHAIRRGVLAGAKLIVVAPCCHQEVRPQLTRPEPLTAVLGHGLLAERLAEWVTDGLRTLVLEWAGYRTKVIEFVGSEHTAKNTMLAAVRTGPPPDAGRRAAARDAIDRFRAFFGIERHALDALLAGEVAG